MSPFIGNVLNLHDIPKTKKTRIKGIKQRNDYHTIKDSGYLNGRDIEKRHGRIETYHVST